MAFFRVMSKKIYIFYKKLVLFLDDLREDTLSNNASDEELALAT